MKIPSFNSKQTKISILVFDKFPHMDFSNKHDPDYDLEKHNTYNFKEEARKMEEYRSELFSLSDQEIDALYKPATERNEEKRNLKAQRKEHDLFHKPEFNADYDYWLRADYWTVEECLALTFGKNPKEVHYSRVSLRRYSEIESSPFVKKYDEVLGLMQRSIESGSLRTMPYGTATKTENKKIVPTNYVSWAKSKNIPLPEKLSEVPQPKIQLKEEHFLKILGETADNNKAMAEEILRLKDQLKISTEELEKSKSEKSPGINEKRSLLKIIYGMAIGGYGWKPELSKSQITTDITRDVNENCNKPITDDTVRKWLKEAKQLAEALEQED